MKAYRVELLIVDYDGIGGEGIRTVLEEQKYPNRCIVPSVMQVDGRDIGEWSDDHPLNRSNASDEYQRLFGQQWSKDIPTQDGYYWFFGLLWGPPILNEKPRYEIVEVRRVSNGTIYIGAGAGYDPRKSIGSYIKMDVPDPPKENNK